MRKGQGKIVGQGIFKTIEDLFNLEQVDEGTK